MRIRWRGLELPTRVEPDKSVSSITFGKFIVEPFERGFGTTVGNSLRRILLSSLEGAAPISVKIAGVEHEFAQLDGVMEDVTDIILNVKSLIISMEGDMPKVLSVTKKGPGVVTGGDLMGDASVTVHNKNQVIATLTSDREFNIEMDVHKGRGFVTALENTPEEQIIGTIPIDSVYSPVTRVRYKTEDTRVGQKTNYDRLIMEIWTNGTVSPDMALVEAAKILRKHLNAFVQHFEPGDNLDAEMMDRDIVATPQMNEELQNRLNQPIGTMDLSVRASNCLESAKIHTIGDLVKLTEGDLLKVRSFGKTSLREVKRKLQDLGLSLGMTIGGPAPQPAAVQ
ncbi:MAG TPA: DNA-directed RNA polymerase subunit alpha [Phycisphaerae bacterium]|jgi:DNA-directed RNA polymerase subunit alpha